MDEFLTALETHNQLVSLLLTAAIACAVIAQTCVARRLHKLEEDIERRQTKITIFTGLKHAKRPEGKGVGVDFHIGNLSHVGIWLDAVEVCVRVQGKEQNLYLPVNEALSPFGSKPLPIESEIRTATAVVLGIRDAWPEEVTGTVVVSVDYWAGGSRDKRKEEVCQFRILSGVHVMLA